MNRLILSKTNQQIVFETASVSNDVNSWLWQFNAEIAEKIMLRSSSLKEGYLAAEFTIGAQIWSLILEEFESNDTGFTYSLRGRSKSVLLAEPYSVYLIKTWTNTTAKAIVKELCDNAGITLAWDIEDWFIASYVANKMYPIDIISDFAQDIGAKVQSLPDGMLWITAYPAVSPDILQVQTADYQLATDKNIFERSEKFINYRNYNFVLVTTDSALANTPSVSIEEAEDGYDRLLKIFITPFHAAEEINIYHKSSSAVGMHYEGIYREKVTETVIIEDGAGQLSKPFDTLVKIKWQQDVPGALTFANDGKITCSSGVIGLVTVTYYTKFLRYRFSNPSFSAQQTLVVIDELLPKPVAGTGSIIAKMGLGDNQAPPIVVKTLSTTAALLARGKAELWPQVYDAKEYSLQVAYQGMPLLPAKIVQVKINAEAQLFNALLKSVTITINDTDITQSVVLERPLT